MFAISHSVGQMFAADDLPNAEAQLGIEVSLLLNFISALAGVEERDGRWHVTTHYQQAFRRAAGHARIVHTISLSDADIRDANGEPLVPGVTNVLAYINGGHADGPLQAQARFLADLPQVVAIRYGQEQNGDWMNHGMQPQAFKAAFRRIHRLFRQAGNTTPFIWSPNVVLAGVDPIEPYYPGDAYVEILGLDSYLREGSGGPDFASSTAPTLESLKRIAPEKPIWLVEVGIHSSRNNRAGLVEAMFDYLASEPRIEMLGYWQRDEYRLHSAPELAALRRGLAGWRAAVQQR